MRQHMSRRAWFCGVSALGLAGINERTAFLTFYSHTMTQRVTNNSPMRMIDRVGQLGIYLDNAPNGDFGVSSQYIPVGAEAMALAHSGAQKFRRSAVSYDHTVCLLQKVRNLFFYASVSTERMCSVAG